MFRLLENLTYRPQSSGSALQIGGRCRAWTQYVGMRYVFDELKDLRFDLLTVGELSPGHWLQTWLHPFRRIARQGL